jgi:hypothetical protein
MFDNQASSSDSSDSELADFLGEIIEDVTSRGGDITINIIDISEYEDDDHGPLIINVIGE